MDINPSLLPVKKQCVKIDRFGQIIMLRKPRILRVDSVHYPWKFIKKNVNESESDNLPFHDAEIALSTAIQQSQYTPEDPEYGDVGCNKNFIYRASTPRHDLLEVPREAFVFVDVENIPDDDDTISLDLDIEDNASIWSAETILRGFTKEEALKSADRMEKCINYLNQLSKDVYTCVHKWRIGQNERYVRKVDKCIYCETVYYVQRFNQVNKWLKCGLCESSMYPCCGKNGNKR